MGVVRKTLVLAFVFAFACFAVSPQATVNVWGYKAMRGVYLLPYYEKSMVVNVIGGDETLRSLANEVLLILEEELSFRSQRTITVIVDEKLSSQGMSGYYQLGIVAIAPPTPSALDRETVYGTMLHEMAHLAVDYLAHGNYPAWFTEGIAVYLELRYVGSTWVDIEQERAWSEIGMLDASLHSEVWDEQAAAYWQSYALVSYLYAIGGRESVVLLLKELGKGETMLNTLSRIYGIDIDVLTREALVSFRARQEAVE